MNVELTPDKRAFVQKQSRVGGSAARRTLSRKPLRSGKSVNADALRPCSSSMKLTHRWRAAKGM
jgi:hypothetical protein